MYYCVVALTILVTECFNIVYDCNCLNPQSVVTSVSIKIIRKLTKYSLLNPQSVVTRISIKAVAKTWQTDCTNMNYMYVNFWKAFLHTTSRLDTFYIISFQKLILEQKLVSIELNLFNSLILIDPITATKTKCTLI